MTYLFNPANLTVYAKNQISVLLRSSYSPYLTPCGLSPKLRAVLRGERFNSTDDKNKFFKDIATNFKINFSRLLSKVETAGTPKERKGQLSVS